MLRGVYFTSGTQEGTAFDRVMGAIKRYLQVNAPPAPPPGPGKSYFLKELLQQVIFRDAGVAGTNLRWYRRKRAIDLAGYGLIGVLLVVVLGACVNSWRNNRDYVAEVDTNAKAFNKAAARGELPTVVDSNSDIASSLPVLDRLRDLPKSSHFDIGDPPMGYRFGLYQGEKLQAATDGVYQRALEGVLLPQAAQRVEQALREASKTDAEYSYEALKAYLMLYDAERYDADFLQAWLLTDVDRKIGAGLTREQRTNLESHLKALFAERVVTSPFAKDDRLVTETRNRLAGVPLAQRAYARLRRILLQTSPPNAFSIAEAAGAESALVIKRTSGKPLTDGIPTLFTYRGYWDIFDKRMAETTLALEQEDRWVLQIRAPGMADITSRELLLREVRRLYLTDYIRVWDDYLLDVRLADSRSLLQSIQMTRVLSTSESPMSRLIRGAARETDLLRNHDEATRSLLDQAQNRVASTRERIEQLIGQPDGSQRRNTVPDRPESLVDNHFAPLRRMVTAPKAGGQAPIDATAALINELYTFLTATDTALRSGNIPPSSDAVTKVQAEAGRLPVPFQGMLNDLGHRVVQGGGGDAAEHRAERGRHHRPVLQPGHCGALSVLARLEPRRGRRRLRAAVRAGRHDGRLLPEEPGLAGRHLRQPLGLQEGRGRQLAGPLGVPRFVPEGAGDPRRVLLGHGGRAHALVHHRHPARGHGRRHQPVHARHRRPDGALCARTAGAQHRQVARPAQQQPGAAAGDDRQRHAGRRHRHRRPVGAAPAVRQGLHFVGQRTRIVQRDLRPAGQEGGARGDGEQRLQPAAPAPDERLFMPREILT